LRAALLKSFAASALALASTLLLTSCGTTSTPIASRSLPAYEPPMAKADFQTVRTTAYTHTEADHVAYGSRNALGGFLQSATTPEGPYRTRRALPISDNREAETGLTFGLLDRHRNGSSSTKHHAKKTAKSSKKSKHTKVAKARKPEPPRIGSAAADWSRWPVGTTFRVLSTGQVYRIDDTGWALAGRNTIDLYMASRRDMNNWGVRTEPIQVMRWGDARQSLALLESRQRFKHCRRMALELQGLHEQAAALH
jgi:3D (Asp-Asp-Asp) domain-containing protein